MSAYFQRLAQRTGLVAPLSSRAGARHQVASSGSSPGLDQEQIVEAPQPRSAPAAAQEHSRNQMKTAVRDAAMPLHEPVQPAPLIEEREKHSTAVIATTVVLHGLDTESIAPPAPQRQPARTSLEQSEQRQVAPTSADARPVRDRPLQPHAENSAPGRAQPDSESIELEALTSSRARFVTELPGRPDAAQPPMPRAPTAIDVRIGTVAVEIHQAAPQPVAPQPTPMLVSAPRPAAPRERFSPSRHYIRMD